MLPQLAIASIIRQCTVRKWVWVAGALVQALCIIAMLVSALTLTDHAAGYAILASLIVFSLARGFNSIASKDVLGKVIPKQQRGNISGLAASFAGFATLTFGLGLWYLQTLGFENGVYIALMLAVVMWLFAALSYSQIKEYAGATEGAKNGLVHALSKLTLLYEDKQFAHFVFTRALLLCSALSAPFYIVLASEQAFDFSLLATFMALSGLASLVSAPIWGRLSDLDEFWLLPLCYFFLTVAHQGVRLGRKTYLVDMAQGNKRTDYVAVSNTVIGFLLLILGSVGLLNEYLSTAELILLYSLLGLAGAISAWRLPNA